MAHWAAKGIECVCIEGLWFSIFTRGRNAGPVRGQKLVINSVEEFEGEIYLAFKEWPKQVFGIEGFRPLVLPTQEQDVALFAHLLDQNSIRVSEPVA